MTAAQALASRANPYNDVFVTPRPSVSAWEREAARGTAAAVADSSPYEGVGGPVSFDELDGQTRLDIINQILAMPEVRQTAQRRNAALYNHMRHGGRDALASHLYENVDRMLAQMIGFNFIGGASRCKGNVKSYGAKQLFSQIDASDPEQRALKERSISAMEGALFISAVLEQYIKDANEAMQKLFEGRNLSFDLFADVQLSMGRLRAVFGQSRTLSSPAVAPLFEAYAESIKQYLAKRVSAFMHKADAVERKQKKNAK